MITPGKYYRQAVLHNEAEAVRDCAGHMSQLLNQNFPVLENKEIHSAE